MDIDELIEDFADEIHNGENGTTVHRYKVTLRGWLEWCQKNDITLWEADSDDLENHLNHLRANDYANNYLKVRRSAVSRFYDKCAPEGVENPSEELDMTWTSLDGTKKNTALRDRDYYIDDEEFEQMIENAPAPKSRNIAILKVLRRCGLRRGELVKLREQDIDEGAGVIRVYREKMKDDASQTVGIPVPSGLMLELTRWRDVGRKSMGGYNPDSPWLFPSMKKEKITGTRVNMIVKDAAESAGIQSKMYTDNAGRDRWAITSHSLRFSAAKDLQDKGVGIDKIQTFLGHSTVDQTEHYLRGRESAMQEAVRQSFGE